ncbi:MAG: A24 family peptidase [Dehalococcoidia bacterium]|nr:A24 family peptidase [Dehalococcoidia bacterium]
MASGYEGLLQLALAVALVAAVIFDLRERRIPNWVTLPGIVAGLALQSARGGGDGLVTGLAGAAVGTGLLALPFSLKWVGGGDVKLLAAVGAFMGATFTLWALLFACAAGGIIAMGWLAFTGNLVNSVKYIFLVWLPNPGAKPDALKTGIPFGPALAIGAFAAVLIH